MNHFRCSFLLALSLVAVPAIWGQTIESSIMNRMKSLRSVPAEQRPAATIRLSNEIRTLPAGMTKVKLADSLTHMATAGDPNPIVLQSAAETLSGALFEWPVLAKDGQPPVQYMDLARLVRYEHVTTDLQDPMLLKAGQILAANDAGLKRTALP
jgi:hypothetical protein